MTRRRAPRTMDDVTDARAAYLAALGRSLVGPRRVRHDLLREAGDHLDDATAAYVDAGWTEEEAAAMAVRDFGPVEDVAAGYQTTLAVAASRRTSALLLGVLGVQPFIWDGPVAVAGVDATPPEGWLYAALDVGVEAVGAVVLGLALLLVLATGIGNRWWHAGRHTARLTARVTLGAAVVMPAIGAGMTFASSGLEPAHLALLAGFIVVPMAVAAGSARRTLAAAEVAPAA